VFRKRSEPVQEEAIPDDLLASIPEMDAGPPELHRLVEDMRRHLDAMVARELDQVEASLTDLVEGLQERLAESEARVRALETQNRAFAQRFAKLRELTSELDPRG